jgi:hypothetical protein
MVRHTGEDFINVEGVAAASVLSPPPAWINGTELDTGHAPRAQRVLWVPEAYRFSGYSNASLCEQIFNILVAEVESIVQPDCVGNDIGWGAPSWNRWRL